jgi:hypothetical protein
VRIHPDQTNVELLCEHAHFVDSGYQSFHDQVRHLTEEQTTEAAFFAGAALALKLTQYFKDRSDSTAQTEFLMDLLYEELNDYMESHAMRLEWEPHVPSAWKQ